MSNIKTVEGGVTAAKGFKAAYTEAGIKYENRKDMAMVFSETPCVSAGTFTSNVVKAACVQWDMKIVKSDKPMHGMVINTGIANACTGKEGFDACEATAGAMSDKLGVPVDSIAVGSTGVIGMQLPVDRLIMGVNDLCDKLDSSLENGTNASIAIMTTDTVNKEYAVQFELDGKTVTLGGMSKGSGMIHPNMCTMIALLTSDIAIEKSLMQEAVSEVIADTFNMISVDGDTSTNDTFILMANGLAGNEKITSKDKNYEIFKEALMTVCRYLARKMASDGEGATKLFTARVYNARSKEEAKILSRSIISSSLSKAAIYGCDANFGRFLCAMGYSGVDFDQTKVELFFRSSVGTLQVFKMGVPLEFDEEYATKIMSDKEVIVDVDMHDGEAEAEAWGCDLTYDYVKINADYRS
ncbi:MAG: bifunctional ornithine acetyltransferase/N-acetylglutamate synthase [Lachnospiraceae bacterium]|nr:bifunctional ornithine acetyltransferase/N-acetylglutamate synthase [Lachnospiraceae bacterium]